ncbi:SIR2 family protein [Hanstruepera ponticola]|uniref:SIR2 family protein n=1 Tax=Hanstruepera ponticola TaxID=2042995 RepID=UPI000CF14703|nr:SIR2 family protein [Hanstruepera ponticola]
MNITYLIGAGASFESLPIVNQIEPRLLEFSELFKPYGLQEINSGIYFTQDSSNFSNSYLSKYEYKSDVFYEKYNLIKQIYDEIIWLHNESKNQSSIDTLAKKLFLQKDYKNLKRLKVIMSCFFYFCQTQSFDKRYDSFFASILDNLDTIPKNIRIVSWNYDSQFEIAFKEFSKGTIDSARKTLNTQINGVENDFFDPNMFSIFKLNGMTSEKKGIFIDNFDYDKFKMMEEILSVYDQEVYRSFESSMSFAWEYKNEDNNFFKNLFKSLKNTDLLVIVGYSFPFFNRKIDKDILDSMPELKKIYVQDPNNSEGIIQKIKSLIPKKKAYFDGATRSIQYIPVTFADQFYIPVEF